MIFNACVIYPTKKYQIHLKAEKIHGKRQVFGNNSSIGFLEVFRPIIPLPVAELLFYSCLHRCLTIFVPIKSTLTCTYTDAVRCWNRALFVSNGYNTVNYWTKLRKISSLIGEQINYFKFDKLRYFVIAEFNNCLIIRSPKKWTNKIISFLR